MNTTTARQVIETARQVIETARQVIEVTVIPSVAYGNFTWSYKPVCAKGEQLLTALKRQHGYKATVNSKTKKATPRTTITQEWLTWAQDNLKLDFRISDAPVIRAYSVGELVDRNQTTPSAIDFSFLN